VSTGIPPTYSDSVESLAARIERRIQVVAEAAGIYEERGTPYAGGAEHEDKGTLTDEEIVEQALEHRRWACTWARKVKGERRHRVIAHVPAPSDYRAPPGYAPQRPDFVPGVPVYFLPEVPGKGAAIRVVLPAHWESMPDEPDENSTRRGSRG
jgi:hypothetical protein